MNKLDLNTDEIYQWSSNKIKCPDKKLAANNYDFYKSLKIDDNEYVIGSGILIKNNDDKIHFACIHYFYEINFPIKNRYRVAVEFFHKPNEIPNKLINCNVEFDVDYEVIKNENVVLNHFNVTSIVKRCLLVYGLKEEDPLELLHEFKAQTTDPIYICRFISCFVDDTYILRDAIGGKTNAGHLKTNAKKTSTRKTNESIIEISDSDEANLTPISKKYKNFNVRTCIENNSKILLKISQKTPEKSHIFPNTPSPSTLLKNLRISDKKTPNKDLSSINKNLEQLMLNSPEKMNPVILLDRVNTPNVRKSSRLSAKCPIKNPEPKPEKIAVRRSSRSSRKSYSDFYEIDEMKSPKKWEKINEENEEPQTPIRKKRTSVVKMETTPKKIVKTNAPKNTPKINTPKTNRLSRVWLKNMTPSVQERDSPIVFGNTPMSRARLGLSAHNVPIKIPCREAEYLSIYNFVSVRIKDQTSGCMYISGVPGTGKTMTVCKVMQDMSELKEDYEDFFFLKLNALALTEPRQIYVEIIKKLLNKKLHWEEALKEINSFFKSKKKKQSHVILIDELDKLCNRKQDVVYNLLDLPFNSVTPLIVITIANTMDLPERILSNKVNSRLGLVRQTFKPYQYKDLVKIVTERMAGDAVFKNEALELVARKVAAVSGDARRALTMCSRATEIAEEEEKDLITMEIVDRVIKEMSSSSKVQAIQCCSKLEQFILSSIANEVTRTGNEEVPFLNMLYNLEKYCVLESFKLPAIELILKSCHNLGSFRLLITQHGRFDLHMTLMLNISTDDIHYALRTTNN